MDKVPEGLAAIDKAIELATDLEVKKQYRTRRAYVLRHYAQSYRDAAAGYESLIRDYPNAPQAGSWYSETKDCYVTLEKMPEALAAIDKAIEVSTDREAKKQYRASRAYLLFFNAHSNSEALREYESVLKDYPDAPEAAQWRYETGLVYMSLGRRDEAKSILADVVANSTGYLKAAAGLHIAICLVQEGKKNEAVAVMDKCYQDGDCRPEALLWKGELLWEHMGRYKDAIPVYSRFITEYPSHPSAAMAKHLKAVCLERLGRVDEAVDLAESLAEDNTTEAKAGWRITWIADMYFRAERYREAAKAYMAVMKTDDAPDETKAKATYHYALCYDKRGYHGIAQNYMWKVVKQYPESNWARNARGQLYLWGALELDGKPDTGR